MPARVVVVPDDPDFGLAITVAIKVAGYEVAMFADSLAALEALHDAKRIEMLITGAG
jgi:DNA-binding NtrC family response regulator